MADQWPEGVDRIILDSVDSTMAEVRRRADHLVAPVWILAREQTRGTGRRGRVWHSAEGNFSASLLLRPGVEPPQLGLRSFVAALALFDALVAVTGRTDIFALKWPNDVLLRRGKLAGILLESLPGAGTCGLIVGIGVNLTSAPGADQLEPGAEPPKSLMAETGATVTSDAFLDALAPAFARWEDQLQTYGFAPIRAAWLALAANRGQQMTARVGSQEYKGRFETVDEAGALILKTPEGRRAIAAGDVFF